MSFAIYVPKEGTFAFSVVKKGSAVVAKPDGHGNLTSYYEGNVHGAENLRTWEERVRVAWYRMRDRAATAAVMLVPEGDMIEVGSGDEQTGWPYTVTDAPALSEWLRGTDVEPPAPDSLVPPVHGLDYP